MALEIEGCENFPLASECQDDALLGPLQNWFAVAICTEPCFPCRCFSTFYSFEVRSMLTYRLGDTGYATNSHHQKIGH